MECIVENVLKSELLLKEDFDVIELTLKKFQIENEQKKLSDLSFKTNIRKLIVNYGMKFLIILIGILIQSKLYLISVSMISLMLMQWIVSMLTSYQSYRKKCLIISTISVLKHHFLYYKKNFKIYRDFDCIINNGEDNKKSLIYLSKFLNDIEQSIRSQQRAFIGRLVQDIQALIDFAHISDDYEKLLIQNLQLILENDQSVSELHEFCVLVQSNFLLVFVLSLCNHENSFSDSFMKRLFTNLKQFMDSSISVLNSDYKLLKSLSSSISEATMTSLAQSTEFSYQNRIKINDEDIHLEKSNEKISLQNNFIKTNHSFLNLQNDLHELLLRLKILHTIAANMEHFSHQVINDNDETNEKTTLEMEAAMEVLSRHWMQCENLIGNLKIVCAMLSKRNAKLINDNENNSIEVPNYKRDLHKNNDVRIQNNYEDEHKIEDQVFQFVQSRNSDSVNNSMSDLYHFDNTDCNFPEMQLLSKRLLSELKTVLTHKKQEWELREKIALSKINQNDSVQVNDLSNGNDNEDQGAQNMNSKKFSKNEMIYTQPVAFTEESLRSIIHQRFVQSGDHSEEIFEENDDQ